MIRKDWKSEMLDEVITTAQLNDLSHNHTMQVYIYSCSVWFGIGQLKCSFINKSRILQDSRNLQMIRKDWKSEMLDEVITTAQLNDLSHNHTMQVYIYSCSVWFGSGQL